MQRTWWPEASTIIVTGPYLSLAVADRCALPSQTALVVLTTGKLNQKDFSQNYLILIFHNTVSAKDLWSWGPLICADLPGSSWWLLMPWCLRGTRASATTMITVLRSLWNMYRIVRHTHQIAINMWIYLMWRITFNSYYKYTVWNRYVKIIHFHHGSL